MCEACKTVAIKAYVQENGWIRIEPSGRIIGRLCEGETFEHVRKLAETKPQEQEPQEVKTP